ncbi:hypothetical protein [Flavobacterium muglaense]|uniref:Uncharacterized protein n=1 Tax=Flavobacterium muglaense TaxID=2764716 RepID=A0A923SHH7_9FLAO|nr:hypothetical protein [Flavobacterium muglaense]MBC5839223.1 hypothetical protein [Flavobacterium muglaense]MBC5845699.1 hypothetical protein [Flavobacterium muglaense]
MEDEKRNAIMSLSFYGLAIVTILYVNVSGQYKSGPCTPNLDIMSVFLIGPISFILMVFNGFLLSYLHKETKYSFRIHLSALLIWGVFLLLN